MKKYFFLIIFSTLLYSCSSSSEDHSLDPSIRFSKSTPGFRIFGEKHAFLGRVFDYNTHFVYVYHEKNYFALTNLNINPEAPVFSKKTVALIKKHLFNSEVEPFDKSLKVNLLLPLKKDTFFDKNTFCNPSFFKQMKQDFSCSLKDSKKNPIKEQYYQAFNLTFQKDSQGNLSHFSLKKIKNESLELPSEIKGPINIVWQEH